MVFLTMIKYFGFMIKYIVRYSLLNMFYHEWLLVKMTAIFIAAYYHLVNLRDISLFNLGPNPDPSQYACM